MSIPSTEQLDFSYYHFFIYSDTGSCIYKHSSQTASPESIGAMQGIIQALFFSSHDLNCTLHLLSTDLGALAYKHFTFKDNVLLLCIIFPNFYGNESLTEQIVLNLLDLIYRCLLIHIGITDLFSFNKSNDIEMLRRYLEIYEQSITHLITHHSSLQYLLKAERKYEIEKDTIYSVKYYLEKIKNKLKLDLVCLTIRNVVVWASNDWLNIDISDRLIFIMIAELYGNYDINEIPIYFSKTLLEDEGIGKISYRLFSVNLMKDTKMILLSDNDVTIDAIDLTIFDDFFISRIINMKNIVVFNNDIIDQNAKCVVVVNTIARTFKVMLDEGESEKMWKFIVNCAFVKDLFENESTNNTNTSNALTYSEFYLKNFDEETFYFYKADNEITFLLLFDKDKTFDDINSVKLTLKNMKDVLDNKDNYKDSTTDYNPQ